MGQKLNITRTRDNVLEKLQENIIDLLNEAEILHKHGRIKRAAFLSLTAFEELEKFKAYKKDPQCSYVPHEVKQRRLNEALWRLPKKIQQVLTPQSMTKDIIEKLPDFPATVGGISAREKYLALTEGHLRETSLMIVDIINGVFSQLDMMKMRNAMLYVDRKYIIQFETEEELKSLDTFYIKMVNLVKDELEAEV